MTKTTIAIEKEDKKIFAWCKDKYEQASKKKYSDSEFFHAVLEMILKTTK